MRGRFCVGLAGWDDDSGVYGVRVAVSWCGGDLILGVAGIGGFILRVRKSGAKS